MYINFKGNADELIKLLNMLRESNPNAAITATIEEDTGKPNAGVIDEKLLQYFNASDRNKIQTIKLCRELTNKGLKEAKDHVESLLVRVGLTIPNTWDLPK